MDFCTKTLSTRLSLDGNLEATSAKPYDTIINMGSGVAMKALLWIIGVPVGGFAALFLYFLVAEIVHPDQRTEVQKIHDNCVRVFGPDDYSIKNCEIRMMEEVLLKRRRQQLDEARKGL
jgi:hypothetical protein